MYGSKDVHTVLVASTNKKHLLWVLQIVVMPRQHRAVWFFISHVSAWGEMGGEDGVTETRHPVLKAKHGCLHMA